MCELNLGRARSKLDQLIPQGHPVSAPFSVQVESGVLGFQTPVSPQVNVSSPVSQVRVRVVPVLTLLLVPQEHTEE